MSMSVTIKYMISIIIPIAVSPPDAVDAYGRKVETDTFTEDMNRFYQIDEDDAGDGDGKTDVAEPEKAKAGDNTKAIWDTVNDPSKVGFAESSSDEEDYEEDMSSSDEDSDEMGMGMAADDGEEEDEEEEVPLGDETSRFAVLNLEWDRIRALDLYMMMQSFLPEGGILKSVTIYPSDYGLEQMEKVWKKRHVPTEMESFSVFVLYW